MTTLLIVEDLPIVRKGLAALAATAFQGAEVLEAEDVASASRLIDSAHAINFALIDLHLPDGSGTELLRKMRVGHPEAYLLVSTIFDDDGHIFPALQAGADGYILKDRPPAELLEALHRAQQGMPALSPTVAKRILLQLRAASKEPELPTLTHREQEVLAAAARGLRLRDIAKELRISEHTTKDHLKSVYRKLHIASRAEAALEARKLGLV